MEKERDAQALGTSSSLHPFSHLYLPGSRAFYDPASANLQTRCWAQYCCIHDLYQGSETEDFAIP